MATHAPPSSVVTADFIKITLLFSYLGLGVAALFSAERIFSLFSYFWLATVIISVVTLFAVSYVNSPNLTRTKESRLFYKQQLQIKVQQEVYEDVVLELDRKYKVAINDLIKVNNYLEFSVATAKQYKSKGSLPFYFANYTTKLMIKYIENQRYRGALIVFDSYVDSILPYAGLSDKSSDVASHGIILSVYLDDVSIFNKVNKYLLDENITEEINNTTLLFNLACYYALNRDKEKLILYINLARQHGKSAEYFLNDTDFNYYMNDQDFLYAINNPE
jgi:hypothetical protein